MWKALTSLPIWAYVMAAMALGWGLTAYKLKDAVADRAVAQAAVAKYETTIANQKAEAATILGEEKAKVTKAEGDLKVFKAQQENKDEANQTTITALEGRVAALTGDNRRLRDPNAQAARCGPSGGSTQGGSAGPAGNRASSGPETDGLLSTQLTGLLQRLTREADEVNNAYDSCRTDSDNLRRTLRQLAEVPS